MLICGPSPRLQLRGERDSLPPAQPSWTSLEHIILASPSNLSRECLPGNSSVASPLLTGSRRDTARMMHLLNRVASLLTGRECASLVSASGHKCNSLAGGDHTSLDQPGCALPLALRRCFLHSAMNNPRVEIEGNQMSMSARGIVAMTVPGKRG